MLSLVGYAHGSIYLADSFLTGSTPASGEYAVGNLDTQAPFVSPFSGSWGSGFGNFQVVNTGLDYTGLYGVDGGAVECTGSFLGGTQTVVRNFTGLEPVEGKPYYMSGLMSFDANFANSATATAYTGLLNAEEGDTSVSWTIGTQWGFEVNATGGVDAVIRSRQRSSGNVETEVIATDITPGTYQFTVRVEADFGYASNDMIVGWLNPDATQDEYVGSTPQLINPSGGNILLQSATPDPNRLMDTLVLTSTDLPEGSVVTYDEVRLGDTWEEVVAAPGTSEAVSLNELAPSSYAENISNYARGIDDPQTTIVGIRHNYSKILGDNKEYLVGGITETVDGARGYVEFDLNSLNVPAGQTITGVTLGTTVYRTSITGAGVGNIELRLADPSVPVVEMEATWANANASDTWNGGDPTATVLASIDGDTLSAGDEVYFGSTQAFIDAINTALAGDGLLQMNFMAPTAEDRALNNNERNFVGFYSDDNSVSLRPTLIVSFNPMAQTAPTGDLNTITPTEGDGIVISTIKSGTPDENAGDSEGIMIGATGYTNDSEVCRAVASIPVSADMVPEGKQLTGISLKLTVSSTSVDGNGLGDIELRLADDAAAMTEAGVTWNSIDGTTAWTTPGGELGGLLSTLDSDYALDLPGKDVYFESTAEFIAAFEAAVAGDGLLDLIMLAPDTEDFFGISNYISFASDDNPDVTWRPELILELEDIATDIPGDANHDDQVDASDATILAGNWQAGPGATWEMGDFNGDGYVDASDATILAGNWQAGTGAAAVPEPSTIILIASALIGLMLLRRKK
ncbi:MAG: dockerin type I domain-containing protein [Planctomycetia bacterium]